MHLSISTSYIVPAILLNPVLFLHGLNTFLSRMLPPTVIAGPTQRPPYSQFGPAAVQPHIDVQSSENLCWGYTLVIICAQLVAYGQVSRRRAEKSGEESVSDGEG